MCFIYMLLIEELSYTGAQEGRARESADLLKYGAETRNGMWHLRRTGVKVTAMTYIALTISMISRGGVKINVSCYTIKLDFWPWPRFWIMVPAHQLIYYNTDINCRQILILVNSTFVLFFSLTIEFVYKVHRSLQKSDRFVFTISSNVNGKDTLKTRYSIIIATAPVLFCPAKSESPCRWRISRADAVQTTRWWTCYRVSATHARQHVCMNHRHWSISKIGYVFFIPSHFPFSSSSSLPLSFSLFPYSYSPKTSYVVWESAGGANQWRIERGVVGAAAPQLAQ